MMKTLKLTSCEQEALQKFKEEVQKVRPDAELILYGSKARGDDHPDSDSDILILVDCKPDIQLKWTISSIAYEIFHQYGVLIMEVIQNKSRWEMACEAEDPFFFNILKEGIPL